MHVAGDHREMIRVRLPPASKDAEFCRYRCRKSSRQGFVGEDFIEDLGTSVGLWSARAQSVAGERVEVLGLEQVQKTVGAAILVVSGR